MYAKRFEPVLGKCPEIIEYLMSSPDMPEKQDLLFKIRLSVEEIIENVVQYAYENGAGYLEISTDREDNILTIRFKDAGKPFNPLEKPDPDITLSATDRPIGGLGIYLCKQLMDDLYYEYKDNCNTLTIKKKLSTTKIQ
jgi:sigma-B regulation protein RsbU (phosphoserine phosphatase)